MIVPNDILVRETSDGVTVWVSQRLVMDRCEIDDEYLRVIRVRYKQSLPASWQAVTSQPDFFLGAKPGKSWRWGRKDGQYYYDIDTIPNRKPACYRDYLPTKEELLAEVDERKLSRSRERRAALRGALVAIVQEITDNADVRWLQTQSGFRIDLSICREYARALAWCRFIRRTIADGDYENYGFSGQGQFLTACAEILAELRLSNFRVTTSDSLRMKLRGFPTDEDDQRKWIISAKIGNNNRRIVGKYPVVDHQTGEIYRFDVHQAFMLMAYANIDGPQKEALTALYNEQYVPAICEIGEKPVSERTFCRSLTSLPNRLRFDVFRHGEDYYNKHYLTYIPTRELTWAHSLFCGDGSGLISYRYTARIFDKDTKQYTEQTRTRNLYVVMITDVASGYVAGYGIAPEGSSEESFTIVQQAVRMAVRRGGSRTMFEFVSDNAPAFSKNESREWLATVFNRVRRIEAHNSQANPAEKYFRLFKNAVLRSCKEFVRSSHNAAIGGRANTDNMSVYDYPTYAEAVAVLEKRIEAWNNRRVNGGESPAERFARKNPACAEMDAHQLRQIFGTRTTLTIERMRGFVTPQGATATCMYEIPDYAGTGAETISRATGNGYDSRVQVVYDESGADLYSLGGRFIMTCPPVAKASLSYIEATPADRAAREYLRQRKEADRQRPAEALDELQRTSEYMFGYGYDEAVRFGLQKPDINEAYEQTITITAADKKMAERKRRTLERQEATAADRRMEQENADIEARYLARERRKFEKRQLLNK